MNIVSVFGTRPEIIKMSRLIPLLDKNFNHTFIFTGQHYSKAMADIFFEELGVRKPDFFLDTKSSEYPTLIKTIISKIRNLNSTHVLVYGDTNSTLAAAITAKILNKKLVHVEAGLRSFDKEMPEESNRVLTDHMSDLLFTPTNYTESLLRNENITENVFVVGNPIVDAVYTYVNTLESNKKLKFDQLPEKYFLLTLHRQETVDNQKRLKKIINVLSLIENKIIFPIHPRTEKRLLEFGLELSDNVIKTGPLGYLEFLNLFKSAELVLTDSGGVQEEAITLKVPCVTVRKSTERMETVKLGANFLAGIEPESIKKYIDFIVKENIKEKIKSVENPYGNGTTSEKIITILKDSK